MSIYDFDAFLPKNPCYRFSNHLKRFSRGQMASIAELTTLRDAYFQALQDCLSGKDVMFEGNRVTIDDSERLMNGFLRCDKLILKMGGQGMPRRNVGMVQK
jgi:hypothetical protein